MSDQSNIAELERRITAALGRIGAGLDKWTSAAGAEAAVAEAAEVEETVVVEAAPSSALAVPPAVEDRSEEIAGLEAEVARLKTALAAEKATVAQLNERLKASKDRDQPSQTQLEAKVEKMTQQLDVQGLELQRMRKSTVQLREHLRVLHEAAADNMAEPHLINKAMLAELENLRATRHTETAEMDEILAELKPLIEEARANG
jgi:chromosome segregation ATPase